MKYKDMKIKDLIELVEACHDSVYVTECYGTRDLRNIEGGTAELERRGYTVEERQTISIKKEG